MIMFMDACSCAFGISARSLLVCCVHALKLKCLKGRPIFSFFKSRDLTREFALVVDDEKKIEMSRSAFLQISFGCRARGDREGGRLTD